MHVPPRDPHHSQFTPDELTNETRITLARILAGIAVAACLVTIGYVLRSDARTLPACYYSNRAHCAPPAGSGFPLIAWFTVGILVGALVIAWPWFARLLRRITGRG
jgi:uncharacterized membrane protein